MEHVKAAMHEEGYTHMSSQRLMDVYPVYFWNLVYDHDCTPGRSREWADLDRSLRDARIRVRE